MTAMNFKFLNSIRYGHLQLWDVKRYFTKETKSKFEFKRFEDCIELENNVIKPNKYPNDNFKILGVNNKVGVFDAYVEKGEEIKQNYQKVENNWLVYNPYRVNVGSIGLKTHSHTHEWISNAYVVFSCNKLLNPEYVYKLFLTNTFNNIIKNSTAGSVRQNLTFDILKNIKIPLPDLYTQNQLVNQYNKNLAKAQKAENQANELEKDVEKYLLNELGIELPKPIERKQGLQFLRAKDLSRWDCDFLENQWIFKLIIENGKYQSINFGDILLSFQYGISETSDKEVKCLPMLRMNNIFNGELDISNLKYVEMKGDTSKLLLQKGDLLFNRTNSKELVGKTAIFDVDGDFLFASYLIRLKLDIEAV